MQKNEILVRDSGANLHDTSASDAVALFERFSCAVDAEEETVHQLTRRRGQLV